MLKHGFTKYIVDQVANDTGTNGDDLVNSSKLLQYINIKTKSANKGSKARSSFANVYAIYVLIEDYINVVYGKKKEYSKHDGAIYTQLLERQRELPFGSKLQNHALNHRLNEEFNKYFPSPFTKVVLRDTESKRYWINQSLIKVQYCGKTYDLSKTIKAIIDKYIDEKCSAFERFIENCQQLQKISIDSAEEALQFISSLLDPSVDARLFEIVSYSILKYYYHDKKIFWGYTKENLTEENLKLYKTGRTNANDGGIDFVMRPLGYFFQVTETVDMKKYFLDIDKTECYPIRFVIKTNEGKDEVLKKIRSNALSQYGVDQIVEKYMSAIEDIVNIPQLLLLLNESVKNNKLHDILEEILIQSKIEFNYQEVSELID